MEELTEHEKEVELAKAGANKYGIYIDGGACIVDKLVECIREVAPLVLGIIDSESNDTTKQMALKLLQDVTPSIKDINLSDVSITM